MDTNGLIYNWFVAQEAGAKLPCPRCGRIADDMIMGFSRVAHIKICNECVYEESLNPNPIGSWYIAKAFGLTEYTNTPQNTYRINSYLSAVLTSENIDDIMCSALEGGITYWCTAASLGDNEDYLGEFISEQISRGGTLKLYDNEEEKWHVLTLEKFLRGISLASTHRYAGNNVYKWIDRGEFDTGNIDGEAADAIIQYALFNDIIYA